MKIIRRKNHEWAKDKNGKVNEFASSYEYCNGPRCIHCYHSFCVNCNPDGYSDAEKVPCEKHVCQDCGDSVSVTDKFCRKCGADLAEKIIEEMD